MDDPHAHVEPNPGQVAQGQAVNMRVQDENGLAVQQRFLNFLQSFRTEDADEGMRASGTQTVAEHYVYALQVMKDAGKTKLAVDYTHLYSFDQQLATAIKVEFYRYSPFLEKALQNFVSIVYHDYAKKNTFQVSLFRLPQVDKLRSLTTSKIGQLTSFNGTVTRTSEVRPELQYGHFVCDKCGNEVRDVEQQFKYTEPKSCSNNECDNKRAWKLDLHKSKFADWQKVRCQENAQEIPAGSMPRTMDLILRNEVGWLCLV